MEEREGRGRGGNSAGPRLHTACAGFAFTSTEDHCKLIVALGKHLQTREGSCLPHKMAAWGTWPATIVWCLHSAVVPMGGTHRTHAGLQHTPVRRRESEDNSASR